VVLVEEDSEVALGEVLEVVVLEDSGEEVPGEEEQAEVGRFVSC
jgi:hypothetical protein